MAPSPLPARPGETVGLGPLLLVGMSRSGTQLLRELLNRHPRIGIPRKETHFIPTLLRRFGSCYRSREQTIAFRTICGSDFYQDLRAAGDAPEPDELRQLLNQADVRDAIERVMRRCVDAQAKRLPFVWGDKTPNNMLHLPLLAASFPQARVLHIVRDPRDRSASTRRVWGADPLLATELWADKVAHARRDGAALGESYRELRYEDLVSDVDQHMREVCAWLGLDFDERVTCLERPADKFAPNAGRAARVSSARTGQYAQELSAHEIRRIEEIVVPLAVELGYLDSDTAPPHRGVTRGERLLRTGLDRARKVQFFVRRWGPRQATGYIVRRAFLYRLH